MGKKMWEMHEAKKCASEECVNLWLELFRLTLRLPKIFFVTKRPFH